MTLENQTSTRIRATNRLSALRVAKLKAPGLYEDGGGLRLVVTEKGVKRWALRICINGRRVERGLGVWPDVSLETARDKSSKMRAAAKEGRDLRTELRVDRLRRAVTFADAFEAFFATRKQTFSNGKHVQQWENTIRRYVLPVIGKRPVAEITAAEVLGVLQPIWFTKPETASRVLQRVRAVFDSAILRGHRERASPCIGITGELGASHRKVAHHVALPWIEVPQFVRTLRDRSAMKATLLAFEFLILTAARSGEVRGALWCEINLQKRIWTIPGSDPLTKRRMKSGATHVVPLSDAAMLVLKKARELGSINLVFPGTNGEAISDNTLSKLMRDAEVSGTPHGFRSSFKDWAAEKGVRDEVSEAALAHADVNAVRAAYRRTNYLEERRLVMQQWGEFVSSECGSELKQTATTSLDYGFLTLNPSFLCRKL
jgi:integrase